MSFAGKTVIVTGGGTGIGAEAARRFHLDGANVVINGRRADVLKATASAIDPAGNRIAALAGDISDPKTATALVDLATDRFGGVDILLNNAGVFRPTPFLEHTPEDFDHFVGIILRGKFFMAQAASKAMIARGGGAIVQTGSMWAERAVAATPSSAYSAANAGVHAMVRNLAIELGPHRIRVNAVAPAVVETPVYATFMTPEQVAETLPTFNAFHPIGRNGQPGDVVEALLFLASDAAAWITGVVMPVDGGVMARA